MKQATALRSNDTFALSLVQARKSGLESGWCWTLTIKATGVVAYRSNTGSKSWAERNAEAMFGQIFAA